MTLSGDEIAGAGLALAIGGALVSAAGYAIRREILARTMSRKDIAEALSAVEKRLGDRIDNLDKHVETATALWVAMGKD